MCLVLDFIYAEPALASRAVWTWRVRVDLGSLPKYLCTYLLYVRWMR